MSDIGVQDQSSQEARHRRNRNILLAAEATGLGLGAYAGWRIGRRGGTKHPLRRLKAIGKGMWKRYASSASRRTAEKRLGELADVRGLVGGQSGRRGVRQLSVFQRYRGRLRRVAAGRRAFRMMHLLG